MPKIDQIQFHRGLKQTLPNAEVGEPLFTMDTKELYIGMGLNNAPVKVTGVNTFVQQEEPLEQKPYDIWFENSDPENINLFIKDSNNEWITYSSSTQIGQLETLMTNNKDTIVDQVNELYSKLFGNVYNFIVEPINNGTQIKQSWVNPTNQEFSGRVLYMSKTLDLKNYSYYDLNNLIGTGDVSILTDGRGSGFGNDDSITLSSTIGEKFYFKIFTEFDIQGSIVRDEGITAEVIQEDITPPGNVKFLTQVPLNREILLTWENPTDSDLQGIKVVRKTNNYPNHPDETGPNIQVFDLDPSTVELWDTGLVNNVFYYYWLFPYDSNGNYNTQEYNKISTYPTSFAIPDGSGFKTESTNQGEQVRVSWTNAQDETGKVFMFRQLFYSTKPLTDLNREDCTNDPDVYTLDSTNGSGQGAQDLYLHDTSTYEHNTKLYYKLYMAFDVSGRTYYSNGLDSSVRLIDNMPPGDQTFSNTTVFESYMSFNITDPIDDDWAGTYIIRKQGNNQPTNINDGEIQRVNNIRNRYESSEVFFDDTNVAVNIPYTYKLFPFDKQGNINYTSDSITLTPLPDPKQVTNFQQTTPSRNSVKLTWNNPSVQNFENWQETIIVRNTTNIPIDINDGAQIFSTTDRTEGEFIDIGMTVDIKYYYRQFTKDINDNIIMESIRSAEQIPYQVIPKDLTMQEMVVGTDYVGFRWKEQAENGWQKTNIVRNYNNKPETFSDGLKIGSNMESIGQYENKYFIDKQLVSGDMTEQYHGIFPGDDFNSFNINTIFEKTGYENRSNPNNINITSENNGLYIKLNYTTPQENATTGTLVYTTAFISNMNILNNMNFQECYNSQDVELIEKKSSSQDSVEDIIYTNQEVGKLYYMKIFSMYLKNGIYYVSDGISLSHTQRDSTPPSNMSLINVTQGDKEIHLQWIDPKDNNQIGTKLFRSTTRMPESIDDTEAIEIYDSRVLDEYSPSNNKYFVDSEVENGITYYYRFFPYDSSGNYNQTSPTINGKSIQQFVNGIEEIQNQVTRLNVTADPQNKASIDIHLTESEKFMDNSHIDVLKLDTSGQATDSVKTISQFDLSLDENYDYDPNNVKFENSKMSLKTTKTKPLSYFGEIYDQGGNPYHIYELSFEDGEFKKLLNINSINIE